MKKITLLFSLLICYSMSAQTIIWQDDFNDEDFSDWTFIDSDGDGNNWGDLAQIQDNAGNPVTPISLISRSWQQNPLTPDNWAVSPAIDLSNTTTEATLTWITQVAAEDWDEEKYSVYVGTSNDINVLVNSTTSVTQILGDAGNTGAPTNQSLDISSLVGEPVVYVAFRHWDVTDMDFISVDDLTIEAQLLSTPEFALNNIFIGCKDKVVTISNMQGEANYRIMNIAGQEVLNGNTRLESQNIDASNLASGIYIVEVTDTNSNAQKRKKVVIE